MVGGVVGAKGAAAAQREADVVSTVVVAGAAEMPEGSEGAVKTGWVAAISGRLCKKSVGSIESAEDCHLKCI